jgi:hypothetical protein
MSSGSPSSPPAVDADRAASTLLLALSALCLGAALQEASGFYSPSALVLLTIALGLCLLGVAAPPVRWLSRFGDGPAAVVLGLGLVFQFMQLLTARPGLYLQIPRPEDARPFFWGLGAAAVLSGGLAAERPWLGRAHVPLLLLVYALLGAWVIRSSPSPPIDVYTFQRDGVEQFLRGGNPYAMTFPNPYQGTWMYGQGSIVEGRVDTGFVYPPLSLFLVLPAHLIGGDVRYAQLVAFTLAGACLAYARPGRLGPLAAATLLFSPRSFFVLEQAWTEPLVVLLLAATILACIRAPWLAPLAVGLLFASKQYLLLGLPLLWLLRPFSPRQLFAAASVALLVTLPLVLWDPGAFFHSAVLFQWRQPLRTDALSYVAGLARDGSGLPLPGLGFFAFAASAAVALWRCPRTPAGFAAAVALAYFAFFAFNKQAFCNYYFLVLGALCLAIAAARDEG